MLLAKHSPRALALHDPSDNISVTSTSPLFARPRRPPQLFPLPPLLGLAMFLCRPYVCNLSPRLALRTPTLTIVALLPTFRYPVNFVDQKSELLTVAPRLPALRQCCLAPARPPPSYSRPSLLCTPRPLQKLSEAWTRVTVV